MLLSSHVKTMNARRASFIGNQAWLYLGDCIDVLRRMPDASVDAVVTDPPYGINYKGKRHARIANDQRPYIWWLNESFRVAKRNAVLICFTAWRTQEAFRFAIELAGWQIRSQVIWDKQIHGIGDTQRQFAPQHEVMWFATKGRARFYGKRPNSVQSIRYVPGGQRVHPNQKPVELLSNLLSTITKPGHTVLDCFLGSGTTGIASVEANRRFIGIESDLNYFEIAHERIRQSLMSCN